MRARKKRWFKRLLKVGRVFMLIGIGIVIGLAIGESSAQAEHILVVRDGESVRVERPFQERIEVEIPPIPTIPPIPDMPDMPDMPTTIHLHRDGPTFFDVVNGIGTILASFGLIGLGLLMVVRGRRQIIKEKSPESLNK
ncbi:MAG: hypothetical protein H6654_11345 [Ardenticatenaceae bacterium]|nr:hypothetical protein [Anaerolineales bacterium]MCB8937574.1 hypothetical protein [Ardenticatenaceae bacterium]MCB8974143.1 hypothetical protein [Ardenticatenaceae bacterium]